QARQSGSCVGAGILGAISHVSCVACCIGLFSPTVVDESCLRCILLGCAFFGVYGDWYLAANTRVLPRTSRHPWLCVYGLTNRDWHNRLRRTGANDDVATVGWRCHGIDCCARSCLVSEQ